MLAFHYRLIRQEGWYLIEGSLAHSKNVGAYSTEAICQPLVGDLLMLLVPLQSRSIWHRLLGSSSLPSPGYMTSNTSATGLATRYSPDIQWDVQFVPGLQHFLAGLVGQALHLLGCPAQTLGERPQAYRVQHLAKVLPHSPANPALSWIRRPLSDGNMESLFTNVDKASSVKPSPK